MEIMEEPVMLVWYVCTPHHSVRAAPLRAGHRTAPRRTALRRVASLRRFPSLALVNEPTASHPRPPHYQRRSGHTYNKKSIELALIPNPGVDPITTLKYEGEPQVVYNNDDAVGSTHAPPAPCTAHHAPRTHTHPPTCTPHTV